MKELSIDIENESAMLALGVRLAKTLPDGTVISLGGTLGAGKTRLVQAVAEACGIPVGTVVSPTFVLMQAYHGDRPIYHFDAYRIMDDDEFLELGPDEFFEAGGLSFVEWAERVADCMPRDRLEIHIEVTGETSRRATISGTGEESREIARSLAATE